MHYISAMKKQFEKFFDIGDIEEAKFVAEEVGGHDHAFMRGTYDIKFKSGARERGK